MMPFPPILRLALLATAVKCIVRGQASNFNGSVDIAEANGCNATCQAVLDLQMHETWII
jgi:hypothetical protein